MMSVLNVVFEKVLDIALRVCHNSFLLNRNERSQQHGCN
jgi:hypothetical protein